MNETQQPLIAFSTRVRRSPFFEATRRWGCRAYTVYNHMYLPATYAGGEAEYWKLVEDVTLWDVAAQRQVEITGPDAAHFAQLLTSRDLSRCAVDQCRYVLLLADDGGIINDPVMLRLGENHFWFSVADSDVLLWARGVAVDRGLDVEITEPDVSPLQLQGPKASIVLSSVLGNWVEDLGFFRMRQTELDGVPLVVSRTGWSGEKGFEIYLRDGRHGDALWERLMEAGKPHGIAPAAPNQIRRIEAGMLSHGNDMTLDDNPFEVGLERFVDLDMEADFIGKSALQKISAAGVSRRLVGIEIGGEALSGFNADNRPLLEGGNRVGRITSSVYSPRLKKNIGLAMLASGSAGEGHRLILSSDAGDIEVRVVSLPFVAPPSTS